MMMMIDRRCRRLKSRLALLQRLPPDHDDCIDDDDNNEEERENVEQGDKNKLV